MIASDESRPKRSLLVLALIVCSSGCVADSARPGTVCDHCDYRFAYQTPNPCDRCVRGVELPCYGHTPTCWQTWPAECTNCPVVEVFPGVKPIEEIAPPVAPPEAPPALPPTQPASEISTSLRLRFDRAGPPQYQLPPAH
jgi:hypothetical protein